MKNLTLVVMAAGRGSRFGGLKQITPVDEDGNFLIDYSVYDALRSGFTKVIFIIKKENLDTFKETIGSRIEKKIQVEYAFQDLRDVPNFIEIPEKRAKPWGTVHAILSAKDKITGPFAIINADDFYGYSSYEAVADFLKNEDHAHISIPYPFSLSASKFGSVKRGVLSLDKDEVTNITECSITCKDDKLIASPLNGNPSFPIEPNQPVSMNFFGFQKSILADLEAYFADFMKKNKDNLETCECLIPEFLGEYLQNKKLLLKYRVSNSLWLGMTYKEDLEEVKEKLKELKNKNEYPLHLWEE